VLFVEGKDFSVFSKIARIIKKDQVANRSDFAVVPIEGFNPTRLRAFKDGIEKTIGSKILTAVIFDRDYRSENEVANEQNDLKNGNQFSHIHSCKEIENFLLIPEAIEKAINERITESNRRSGKSMVFNGNVKQILNSISDGFKYKTQAQLQSHQLKYEKSLNPRIDETTIIEKILQEFDLIWKDLLKRLVIIPGKDFLSSLNEYLQEHYKISISQTNIINSLNMALVPEELKYLIEEIDKFRKLPVILNKI
jgi:hypothetical protein